MVRDRIAGAATGRKSGIALSLRTRIVAVFTVLTITLIVLVAAAALAITERNLFAAKVSEGRAIVSCVNAAIPVVVGERIDSRSAVDAAQVTDAARRICYRLALDDFVLVDERMQVVAAADETRIGRRLEDVRIVAALTTHETVLNVPAEGGEEPHKVEITGPLFFGGRLRGALRFQLNTADVWRIVNLTRSLILFYIFLDTALIVGLGSYVLYRLLVRPIRDLNAAVERFGEGEFDVAIPRNRSDEIGRLGDAFARMVENLQRSRERQQQQMRFLERVNEDLEQAQKELLSTDRLAYVGRVAAGVAHEVGNPLAAIFGYLDILADSLPEGDGEARGFVTRIEREANRIDDIIRSLLDFAKPAGQGIAPVDAAEVAREATEIVRKQRVMDSVDLRTDIPDSVPAVRADGKLLLQVVVNLLINAKDAMPGGGSIRVTVGHASFDRLAESTPEGVESADGDATSLHELIERHVRFSGKIPFRDGAPVVKITVADTGEGIDGRNLRSIFEPFYTTKAPAGGTGLGLAICQRIVDSFGGVIKADTRPGAGTRFTIYLPVEGADPGARPEGEDGLDEG